MSEKASTGSVAPYKEVTGEEFANAGAKFEIQAISGGIVLRGACPRCHDTMEFAWVDDAYRDLGGGRGRSGARNAGVRTIKVMCTCVAAHPGVSELGIGCGAYWNLNLED